MLNSKTWQFTIWDYIRMVFTTYFNVAFVTKKNTVISFFRTTFSKWYTRNSIGFKLYDRFATFSASRPQPIVFVLSALSHKSGIDVKRHDILPPSYTWRKEPINHAYWCYLGDMFTGMIIRKISRLRVLELSLKVRKYLKLDHPHYRITFVVKLPDGKTRILDLIEFLSLHKAKKVAELYYHQWKQVNQDIAEPFIQGDSVAFSPPPQGKILNPKSQTISKIKMPNKKLHGGSPVGR